MQMYWIPCKIERGGFSSERTFEIKLANGDILAGTAFVRYFLDKHRQPLDEDLPQYNEPLDGFAKCRVVRQISDDEVLIDLPSSDVIRVPKGELQQVS